MSKPLNIRCHAAVTPHGAMSEPNPPPPPAWALSLKRFDKAWTSVEAKACAVTQQKPNAADRNPIELEAHHLFDAATRPDLAALDDNLLVISSALHRNFHKWMGNRPCEPKDFVDYLLRNELTHFEGSPSTRARQEQRQQKLIHRLELLQARYEGNRLLY